MDLTPKKIVLVSRGGYRAEHDALLNQLLARKIEVFCAVGKDCGLWEEVMDELVIGPEGEGGHFVVTTSHPDESVEEVMEFAKSLSVTGGETETNTAVELIEVS